MAVPAPSRRASAIAGKLDPEKFYRELSDRLANTDTIANRAALAAECLKVGRFDEAERHYDHVLALPMGNEPGYALGKAQAQFGLQSSGRCARDAGRSAKALAGF